MNKITTSLLAGVALAAFAVAPASAQAAYTNGINVPLSAFSFSPVGTFDGYTLTNADAAYNPSGTVGATIFGKISLVGSSLVGGSSYNYNNTTLHFVSTDGKTTFNETGATNLSIYTLPSTGVTSYTFSALGNGFSGSGHVGDSLNLAYVAPVPEASTLISFGALLALGGLAVLRRKSVARAS